MYPYYLIILIVLINWGISSRWKSLEKALFFSTMLILFLFAALRGNGDVDYFNYKKYSLLFTTLPSVFLEKSFIEVGFRFISYINNLLNLNPQFVIATMNLISICSVSYVFEKLSINKFLSIFIFLPFYFQLDMHSSRTAVASSLTLLSIYKLYDERYIGYLLSVLLAFSFHKSSIILIIALLIYMFKEKKWLYSIKTIYSLIGFWILKNFISFTSLLIIILDKIGLSNFSIKVSNYSNSQFGKPFSLLDPRLILSFIIFFTLSYLVRNKLIETSDKSEKNLLYLLLIYSFMTIVLFIGLSDVTILAVRITYYFNITSCISIPIIFATIYEKGVDTEIIVPFVSKQVYLSKLLINFVFISFLTVYLGFIIIVLPKVPYLLFF